MQLKEYAPFINRLSLVLKDVLQSADLNNANTNLHQALSYVSDGGKRLRPIIIYLVGEHFGIPLSKLDILAASIELIHCYSLVHDDMPCMDNDDLRRGLPSCHKKFDEATALLVGDGLQALAFEILSKLTNDNSTINEYRNNLQIINILACKSGIAGMVLGQHYDLEADNMDAPSIQYLENMHALKTGALFEAAFTMPYLAQDIIPASKILLELKNIAQILGLAFQIQDDILDASASIDVLGKNGSDAKNNKATFVTILGLEKSTVILKQKYYQALELTNNYPILRNFIIAMLHVVN